MTAGAVLKAMPVNFASAVDAAILSEPFPTLAEDKGVAVRPLTKAPGAKPVPITAIFWNKECAAAHPDLANRGMVAYLKAARDLALGDGWRRWTPPCSTRCRSSMPSSAI